MAIQLLTRRALALLWCLMVASLAGTGPAVAAGSQGVGDAFAHDVRAAGVPGGVVARISEGRVIETRSVGDVSRSSRFLWGSLSKPVAGAVATSLAAHHRLDLTRSASDLVPGAPHVPVQDLLNHTAGMGFGAEVLDVDRPDATAMSVARQHPQQGRAGSPYTYSSLDYLFVQAVVERATGNSYEHAVSARFPDARIGASAGACSNVTRPHRFVGPWAVPTGSQYDGAGAGYGYACGSIDDLASVAIDHLQHQQPSASVPTGHPGQRYSDGWRVTTEPDGRTTQWHTGTVPGYFSAMYLDPNTQDGVVILMDASGYLHEEQLAALTRATFDRATGRVPEAAPGAATATVYPAALLLVALALFLVAARGRSGRRRGVLAWAAGIAMFLLVLLALPRLSGYPYRYFWLWEPSMVVAALALGAALAVGLMTAGARARARPDDDD